MSGTKEGGAKAAATNKKNHGEDFYKRIGSKGGRVCCTRGGFAANPELAKKAASIGGKRSKRGSSKDTKWVLIHKMTGEVIGEYPFKTTAEEYRLGEFGDKAYEYETVRKEDD